jgi:hypothetical protein
MRWGAVVNAEPHLGRLMRHKLLDPGVLLMGSIKLDGRPRISGVEPLVMHGDLWLSMMEQSMKTRDLRRDARIALNSIISDRGGQMEVKIDGRAREEKGEERLGAYAETTAEQLGWRPVVGHFALFQIDLVAVTAIGYDPKTGDQHVARWPQREEYVRAAMTPTSLGPPADVHRIFE